MAYDLDDSDEPLYQHAGRDPMDDALEAAACAQWDTHNPDADELQRWGAHDRIRRLNAEANARAAAEAAGTTLQAIRQARDERRRREAAQRAAQDLAIARRVVANAAAGTPPIADPSPGPDPLPRKHGPEQIVSAEQVLAKKAELGPSAGYKAIATALTVSESTVRRRLGRMR